MSENKKELKVIDFLKYKGICVTISIIVCILSVVGLFTKGLNYGIDFKGGTLLHLKFAKVTQEKEIRDIFSSKEIGVEASQVSILRVHDNNSIGSTGTEYIVTGPKMSGEKRTEVVKMLRDKIQLKAGNEGLLRIEEVGSSVGKNLRNQAIWSILFAIIGLILYISFRFDFKFAIAAIIALVHDCLVTLGIFVLFSQEVTVQFIAAMLTIIGYSLNDTIVISDRIRENIRLMKKIRFDEIVNLSITQSLARTINTSLTTFIPVVILCIFGGVILQNLAIALLIGVVVGTYSSMYIVAPVITQWDKLEREASKA